MKQCALLVILLVRISTLSGQTVERAVEQADIYYEPLPQSGAKEAKMKSLQNYTNAGEIKVIVHGYLANRTHYSIVPVRNAYLSQGYENVFVADWQHASEFTYMMSRNLVGRVGLRFAKIISDFLARNQISTGRLHLIGHSLGAHIVSVIGRYFNGTVGRITGLDPAQPLFSADSTDGLQPSCAKFVDVIHTDIPVFGSRSPLGVADFYPNYGLAAQPGCHTADRRYLTICSHIRAAILFAESIGLPNNFPAIPCPLQDIQSGYVHWCQRMATLNNTVMMGEHVERSARGQYFLETFNEPPYGMGLSSAVYSNS